jgi:hypothetical protein
LPCPIQFHPVFAARIFLDTALPVLAAPHSLPATRFLFLHLSLLPTTLPSSKLITLFLIPECAQPAFRLNREESHVPVRFPVHIDFLQAPAWQFSFPAASALLKRCLTQHARRRSPVSVLLHLLCCPQGNVLVTTLSNFLCRCQGGLVS